MRQDLRDWPRWSRVLAVASVAWVVALGLATIAASRPSKGPLASAVSACVSAVGSLVCHQRPERSFFLWGAQLPVCARCTGLYLGAAVAASVAAFHVRVRSTVSSAWRARLVVAATAVPTVLTLVFEWVTAQAPSHWLRAAAGFPLGAGIAWVIAALDDSQASVEVN